MLSNPINNRVEVQAISKDGQSLVCLFALLIGPLLHIPPNSESDCGKGNKYCRIDPPVMGHLNMSGLGVEAEEIHTEDTLEQESAQALSFGGTG